MTDTFDKLGIKDHLVQGLKKQGVHTPTGIQEKAIPPALENKDIIGQSQTGSGKTLAYLLPIFNRVDADKREMQAIVLAPTHELVLQIDKQAKLLSENAEARVRSTIIIGNVNVERQIDKLKEKPHLIIGTPGRILELIKKKKISAHTIKTIVIDEADRLLDQSNLSVVKDIIKTTLRDRQLMAFSATINETTQNTAKELMKEPLFVKPEEETINPNIAHMYFVAEEKREKIEVLRKLIASINPSKAIVFVNKSDDAHVITEKLQYHKIKAFGLYRDVEKEDRKKAMEGIRGGDFQMLIATDIAARGLDISKVTHVFCMDLSEDSKQYLHRAGRTGRFGASGTAISIITKEELPLIRKYEKDFKIQIQPKEIYKGKVFDLKAGTGQ